MRRWSLPRDRYPMLTGSVCIASKTNAKNSTLQAMAPNSGFHGRVHAVVAAANRCGGRYLIFRGHWLRLLA
jgi:hypothetical protein